MREGRQGTDMGKAACLKIEFFPCTRGHEVPYSSAELFACTRGHCVYSRSLCVLEVIVCTRGHCVYSRSLCVLEVIVCTRGHEVPYSLSPHKKA